jgi:hypothetical protein
VPKPATRSSGGQTRARKRRTGRVGKESGLTGHNMIARDTEGAVTVSFTEENSVPDLLAEAVCFSSTVRPPRGVQAQLSKLAGRGTKRATAQKSVAALSGQDALVFLTEGAREAERRHVAAGRTVATYDEQGRRTGEVARTPQAESGVKA